MMNLIKEWLGCMWELICDDLISYYTFFTVILAECAYLWATKDASIALPFTVILLCYIANVIICAIMKGKCGDRKKDLLISKIYLWVFAVLILIGSLIDSTVSLVVNTLLFGITAVWIVVRTYQNTNFHGDVDERVKLISKIFHNPIFWIVSQIIVVGGPFIVFTIYLANISAVPVILKIIIPVVYLICMPFIALLEDGLATCDIFELAYLSWRYR